MKLLRLSVAMAMAILSSAPIGADTVMATRTIRATETITAGDVTVEDGEATGALSRIEDAVGLEARRNLYAGRPIRAEDVGPPALVERNETIRLVYRRGGLTITTEGRALDRAGVGDRLRVISLGSRQTVLGTVHPDGFVTVSQP